MERVEGRIRSIIAAVVCVSLMLVPGVPARASFDTDSLQGGYTPISDEKSDRIFELNQQGVDYFNANDYLGALDAFRAAYEIDPTDATVKENLFAVYTHLAVDSLNKRIFEEAITYFEAAKAIESSPSLDKNLAYAYVNIAQEVFAQTHDLKKTLFYIEKGLEYDPDNAQIRDQAGILLYNRAMELYGQHEYDEAAEFLTRSLEYNGKQSFAAYDVLGDIAYFNQNMEEARAYWKKAGEIEYSERIVKKIMKLESELEADNGLDDYPSQYFIIKYDKSEEFYSGYKIRSILRAAYRKVGNDFNYYPKRKVVVLLYGPEELDTILSKNHWAGAVYDGKIRLPQESANVSDQSLRALVWHEYTHAIVHDLSGGKAPAWLNEGLAQYEENKIRKIDCMQVSEALRRGTTFDFIREFHKDHKNGTYEEVRMFYLLSFTITTWLMERYRMYKIKEILGHIKDGDSPEVAINKALFLPLDKLNLGWNDYLRKNFK